MTGCYMAEGLFHLQPQTVLKLYSNGVFDGTNQW